MFISTLALGLLAQSLFAAQKPATAPTTASPAPKTAATPSSPKTTAKAIYAYWYTVSAGGEAYQYYLEKAELRGDRIFMLNQIWKREGDFINEEQLGIVAESGPALTPILFNFHAVYKTQESQIDGTFGPPDGRTLSVKIRKGTADLPVVKRSLPPGTLPSTLFPFWVQKHALDLKVGATVSLKVILEDNLEVEFRPVPTQVRREKDDDLSAKLHARAKLWVDNDGVQSVWWVDAQGVTLRVENPRQHLVIERADEAVAKKFLD